MGDAFSPDAGQQVDADGRVTYDFDGHIHADGLDLDAGDSDSPPNDRRIRWIETTGGAAVAELFGWATAAEDGAVSEAVARTAAQRAINFLSARGAGSTFARLFAQTDDDTAADNKVAGYVDPPGLAFRDFTVMDGDGRSSFLQLADGVARIAIDFGWGSVNFPTSPSSSVLTVNHGLGRVPQAIVAISNSTGLARRVLFGAANETSGSFDIAGYNTPGTNLVGGVGFFWVAIG